MSTTSSFLLRPRRLVSLLVFTVCLGWMASALADPTAPSPPGDHLIITEVAVDFDAKTLTITGEHFSFGNDLEVTLGGFGPLNIAAPAPTDTDIVVDFPGGVCGRWKCRIKYVRHLHLPQTPAGKGIHLNKKGLTFLAKGIRFVRFMQ